MTNDYVVKTKDLMDYALGKIPGSAHRDVEVEVSWKSVDIGPDESTTFEIVPSIRIKWTEGKPA
jgi:hypothetical protein